ncbi:hypothetical protein EIP86_004767 [Pleurotus ostreatoroseus]|nr:hypothetical protein EIP86_004767 [Pleurotus ostreatoroseus]
MRRLAAVFTAKRSDKSDVASNASTADHHPQPGPSKTKNVVAKSRSSLFRGLTKSSIKDADAKASRKFPVPSVSTRPQAGSSASSTSGGPTTPSDDQESVGHHNHAKRSWLPSFTAEKLVVPSIHAPPAPPAAPLQHGPYVAHRYGDDASSTSSKSDSADEGPLPPPKPISTSPPLSPVAYFRVITHNALAEPFSPPPLLHVPNCPLYPRSCNPTRALAPSESLRVRMHRKHLLARLDGADARDLAAFAQRRGVPARSKRLSLVLDDAAIGSKRGYQVGPFSQGLRRWAERPCLEDRVVIYLPSEDADSEAGVVCERVSASTAVEALGFSEELELLAALDDPEVQEPVQIQVHEPGFTLPSPTSPLPDLSLTPSTASLSSNPPSPLITGSTASLNGTNTKVFPSGKSSPMYKTAPSPLRMGSSDAVPQLPLPTPRSVSSPSLSIPASLVPGTPSLSTPASLPLPLTPALSPSRSSPAMSPSPSPLATPPAVSPSPRPAVHFAEEERDERDEAVPLEYVMRIRQARDQKKQFLAAERARRGEEVASKKALEDRRRLVDERRRLEEARRRQEEERKRQEAERRRLEQERAAFERERRATEEERKRKVMMDELVEARRRRESSRAGPVPKSNEGVVAWEGDREKERERRTQEARGVYARPRYDESAAQVQGTGTGQGQGQGQGQGSAPPPNPRRQSAESNARYSINLNSSTTSLPRPAAPYAHAHASPSPGSSRPASLAGSQRGSSRPPSMYSTPPSSASDVRARRESKGRRASLVSDGSQAQAQMFFAQGTGTPPQSWAVPPVPPLPMGSPMVPVAVPVPVMPVQMQMQMPMQMQMQMGAMNPMMTPMGMSGMAMNGMSPMGMGYADMPLLPPAAPFMMQSFGPRGGQRSHSASPVRGSGAGSGSERGSAHGSSGSHAHRQGRDEVPGMHRRRASGETTASARMSHPQAAPASASASASMGRASRSGNPHSGSSSSPRTQPQQLPQHPHRQTHANANAPGAAYQRPIPVSTVSYGRQPGFENLSRPSNGRRQTMIT